ncbi:MAG: tetratricopeptide repeat protein [Elusimicrobia bacterium]|nr:tetratricopeptide repeat protein [Elusimicrobiota bacterium]
MQNLPPLRRRFALTAAACAFLAFLPALGGGFLNFDDDKNLIENADFKKGFSEPSWMFKPDPFGLTIPLTWASLSLDRLLWGQRPFGYHLQNLLWHTLATALLYFLALALIRGREEEGPPERLGALAAALFFGLHPLRVESVAWITERRDSLSLTFLLLSTLAYLRHGAGTPRAYTASLCAYALSLAAKPIGMGQPFLLLALDRYFLKRKAYKEKLPFLLLSILTGALVYQGIRGAEKTAILEPFNPLQHASYCAYGLVYYLRKTLVPSALSPLHPNPPHLNPLEPHFLASGAAAALLLAVFWKWRRHRGVWTAGLQYLLGVAPVLGIARNGPQLVADRYSYLSCLGWAVLAGAALSSVLRRVPESARPALLKSARVGLCALALGFIFLSWDYCGVWKDSRSLWSHVLSLHPDSHMAHNNLGVVDMKDSRLKEAERHFRAALSAQAADWTAASNLGSALLLQGRAAEALEPYRTALALKPGHAQTRSNFGAALLQMGDMEGAVREFSEALRLKPDWVTAQKNLESARELRKKGGAVRLGL